MNNTYLEILFNNAKYFDESGDLVSKARTEIYAAIAAAVLAEREACEKICDTEMTRQNIAAAIRARKDVTK